METIGVIILPLKKIEIIHKYEDIVDIILDLKIPGAPQMVENMLNVNVPQILVLNKDAVGIIGVLCYQPPEKWKVNEDQELMLFVGPNIHKMTEYFVNWANTTPDPFQKGSINTIIKYLQQLYQQSQNKSSSYTYTIRQGG